MSYPGLEVLHWLMLPFPGLSQHLAMPAHSSLSYALPPSSSPKRLRLKPLALAGAYICVPYVRILFSGIPSSLQRVAPSHAYVPYESQILSKRESFPLPPPKPVSSSQMHRRPPTLFNLSPPPPLRQHILAFPHFHVPAPDSPTLPILHPPTVCPRVRVFECPRAFVYV